MLFQVYFSCATLFIFQILYAFVYAWHGEIVVGWPRTWQAQLKMIKFDILRRIIYIVLLTYLLVVNTSHAVMGDVFNTKIVDCHVICDLALGRCRQTVNSCSWEGVYDILDITRCQQKLCLHGESFQQRSLKPKILQISLKSWLSCHWSMDSCPCWKHIGWLLVRRGMKH